jgi:hypothetical protein
MRGKAKAAAPEAKSVRLVSFISLSPFHTIPRVLPLLGRIPLFGGPQVNLYAADSGHRTSFNPHNFFAADRSVQVQKSLASLAAQQD